MEYASVSSIFYAGKLLLFTKFLNKLYLNASHWIHDNACILKHEILNTQQKTRYDFGTRYDI